MPGAWRGARLLLAAPWIWGAILAASGQPMGSQVCEKGCAKFHPPIPLKLLQSYEKRQCGKPVVFVITKRNLTICTNPKEQWVQDAMRALDAKSATPTAMAKPGEFDKHFGNTVRMSTQAGRAVYPTETFGTAAYGKSTPSVMATEDPKPSAANSVSTWTQTAKFSTGSTSKPDLIVSGATVQPEPFTNGSVASYFTDGPQDPGEGLTPVGKGLEDTSGSASKMVVPPTFLGTPSPSDFHTGHVEKSRGEATTPSPEVPPTFWSTALLEHRSHVISVVFLGFTLSFFLATAWVYAKHRSCTRASPTEMARGVKFSKCDSQTGAYAMQAV